MASLQTHPGTSLPDAGYEAIRRYVSTGVHHCVVERDGDVPPMILPEAGVIAAGVALIDRILWSTDGSEADGLDPALLA
ncbi:hypothetical protein H5V43_03870 [Sphingobium fuliginis]|jgi:hypothetical protein|uniref:Uncharacterized protein n=1 Tax=Sphingobium fuliginis (strain ATCC 27551) TaxID=336203 RepID=A0A7M2GI80_SPHSA|nr:hypothetical protein [Sphingobium fuliginis]QOT72293.1 hypothetical protein H5V43_03870 [Sphingobium fuliginis]